MNASSGYAEISIGLSIVSVIMLAFHLWAAVGNYRTYHDVQAALTLMKGIGLLVAMIGLSISALGLYANDPLFATSGLSITRGALLIVSGVLVTADMKRHEHE